MKIMNVLGRTAGFLFMILIGVMCINNSANAAVKTISSAQELKKIGSDSDYPMNGDYVLGADIDLSGENWIPIGGSAITSDMPDYVGCKGTTNESEPNVFSGTFDGAGHVISGMTINMSDVLYDVDGRSYAQIGLFSVIASGNSADYAEVKNIVFSKVDIKVDFDGRFSTIGTLAGEVNGYAKVDNIAVLDGTIITNPSRKSDTVGTGGIIGECRTEDASITNNNIELSNLYNAADIIASGYRDDLLYAGGIVGRIAKSPCKMIRSCLNVGSIQYDGYNGYGIAVAANGNTSLIENVCNCYCLKDKADLYGNECELLSEASLRNGSLPEKLDSNIWKTEYGCLPAPVICYESSAAGYIYLDSMQLGFAEGESEDCVKTVIELPGHVGDQIVTWTSDNEVIRISDLTATAKTDIIGDEVYVILTAVSSCGYKKSFKVKVIPDVYMKAHFQNNYAKPHEPLKVVVDNPGTNEFNYEWRVDGNIVGGNEDTYTPTDLDDEKMITLKVTSVNGDVTWNLNMYVSALPVVYIDTDDDTEVESNSVAEGAYMRLQGNDEFCDGKTLYEGKTTIKGRGNSTWSYAVSHNLKRPYKLKLDSKSNLLGLGANGKNKHWVLLANIIDHTNMRNELAHNFSRDIGMQYWMGSTNVVLILNGEYQGVYQLCEHVRVGKSRIDVFDWEGLADDVAAAICRNNLYLDLNMLEEYLEQDFTFLSTGIVEYGGNQFKVDDYYTNPIPERTGGFLLDMDFRSNGYGKYISNFISSNTMPMFFRAPEYAKTSTELMNYTIDYINAYEDAIKSSDFSTNYKGTRMHYSDLMDMDSLIQYWYVCELTNNWDSMKNSTYVYKDIDGKAYMGPAWDYDWAFGNIDMYYCDKVFVTDRWHTELTGISTDEGGFAEQEYQKYQWNRYIVKDPYFVTRAYEYYRKYRDTVFEDLIKENGIIDTLYNKYASASSANDKKWKWSYDKYSGYAIVNGMKTWTKSQCYDEAVDSLRYFIEHRIDWFDKQFESVNTLYKSLGNTVDSSITIVADNDSSNGNENVVINVGNDDVKYIKYVINGMQSDSFEKYYEIENGRVELTIDYEKLISDGTYNTVVVSGYDSSKKYIDGAMNFANFIVDYIPEPTAAPTCEPTAAPTGVPSKAPTGVPSKSPTVVPSKAPTEVPSKSPTEVPSKSPTVASTDTPVVAPTDTLANKPTQAPTNIPGATATTVPAAVSADGNDTYIDNKQENMTSSLGRNVSIKITGNSKVTVKKKIVLKANIKNYKGKIKWSLDKKGKKLAKLNKKSGKKVVLTAKKKKGKVIVTVKCGGYKAVKMIMVK